MPDKNGELTPQELQDQFRTMSLQELCSEAIAVSQILETEDDEDDLFQQLQQYLTEATQAKVDGYCWYQEMLKSEIDEWKTKKKRLAQMCDQVIDRKQKQLNRLKQNLVRLAELGLIDHYLMGHNKAISIRTNSQPTVEVLQEVDVPEIYRQPQIQWTVDKQAIALAHQAGKDVSAFAKVTYGKQVRFKNAPHRKRKKNGDKS
ncbi:MAG: siphovirus Gp157 family protein [Calothrix sp. MO_192.B10]|nr:siphovirus Gp157 family protein [Calothrix sp. MO_192.B10]